MMCKVITKEKDVIIGPITKELFDEAIVNGLQLLNPFTNERIVAFLVCFNKCHIFKE